MPEHASRFAGLYDQQNENRIADWGGDELFTRMPSPPAVDDAPAPRFRPSLALVDTPAERRRTLPGDEWSGPRDRRRARSADAAMRERTDRLDRRRARSADEAMRERADRLGLSVIESRDDAASATGATTSQRAAGSQQSDEPSWPAERSDEPSWPAERSDEPSWAVERSDEPSWPAERSASTEPPWGAESPESGESPGAAAARRWDEAFGSDALEPPPERAPNGRRTTVITGRPEGAPRPLSLVPAERRRPARTPSDWIGARPERIVAWAFVLGLLLILIAISTADAAPR
jgi:hypothetical protein